MPSHKAMQGRRHPEQGTNPINFSTAAAAMVGCIRDQCRLTDAEAAALIEVQADEEMRRRTALGLAYCGLVTPDMAAWDMLRQWPWLRRVVARGAYERAAQDWMIEPSERNAARRREALDAVAEARVAEASAGESK